MLDKVRVMRIGHFKKFLKVVFGRPSLSLEITFGSRYEPLTGADGFLTAVVIADHYGDAMGSSLLSLLATPSVFPGAFDDNHGGCSPATAGGYSRVS
jgi:hypothetical protein